MRCAQCGYALWNVRGRTCPECGRTFNPADAIFAPNMVEFCCPQCDQQYYGTALNGLIEPREFACVRCGCACSLSGNMYLRLAPGAQESQAQAHVIPWLSRATDGRIRTAWSTIWRCIGSPGSIGRAISMEESPQAWGWLLKVLTFPLVAQGLAVALLIGAMSASTGAGTRYSGLNASTVGSGLLSFTLGTAGGILSVALFACLAAAISWVVMALGPERVRYDKLFACWAYASTPVVVLFVPCVGLWCAGYFLHIWIAVLAGIMMASAVAVRPWQAVLAAALPPLLTMALLAGLFLWTFFSALSGARMAATGIGGQPPAPAAVQDAESDQPGNGTGADEP